jgi:type VI secretion system secreted protein Hcp
MADQGLLWFLKLDGIPGESQDSDYQDQIKLESFSWSVHNASSLGSGSTGGSIAVGQVGDIMATKFADKASFKLMEYTTTGKHIPSGQVTGVKLSGDGNKIPYIVIKLTDAFLTSWQMGASSGDQLPVENFSLHMVKVENEYKVQDNEGNKQASILFNWNIQQNKAA